MGKTAPKRLAIIAISTVGIFLFLALAALWFSLNSAGFYCPAGTHSRYQSYGRPGGEWYCTTNGRPEID